MSGHTVAAAAALDGRIELLKGFTSKEGSISIGTKTGPSKSRSRSDTINRGRCPAAPAVQPP